MHGNAHKVVFNTAHCVSIFATSHLHCLLEALSPIVLRPRAQGRKTGTHPTRPELARLTWGYPGVYNEEDVTKPKTRATTRPRRRERDGGEGRLQEGPQAQIDNWAENL